MTNITATKCECCHSEGIAIDYLGDYIEHGKYGETWTVECHDMHCDNCGADWVLYEYWLPNGNLDKIERE